MTLKNSNFKILIRNKIPKKYKTIFLESNNIFLI